MTRRLSSKKPSLCKGSEREREILARSRRKTRKTHSSHFFRAKAPNKKRMTMGPPSPPLRPHRPLPAPLTMRRRKPKRTPQRNRRRNEIRIDGRKSLRIGVKIISRNSPNEMLHFKFIVFVLRTVVFLLFAEKRSSSFCLFHL